VSLVCDAEAEIKEKGCISPELLKAIFAEDWLFRTMWDGRKAEMERTSKKRIDEIAKNIAHGRNVPVNEARRLLDRNPESVPEFLSFVELETLQSLYAMHWEAWSRESDAIVRNAQKLEVVPDAAVEKVIRYGNAIERQMSRAYARLERLQARRRGELVNARTLDVYLTR
jgi:hypothetical protein